MVCAAPYDCICVFHGVVLFFTAHCTAVFVNASKTFGNLTLNFSSYYYYHVFCNFKTTEYNSTVISKGEKQSLTEFSSLKEL